jgi:thiamine phosphate synthase YjbQ (UPF0047 family)
MFHDVTDAARAAVERSGIRAGTITVYSPHTTCSVIIQEESHDALYDGTKFLLQDMLDRLETLAPTCRREGQYLHPGHLHIEHATKGLGEEAVWSLNNVSGDLSKSIKVQMRRGERGIWEAARIGPTWPLGAHGYLVEFGHALVKGGRVIGSVPPHPFARPAADACEPGFIEGVTADIKKAVEAVL